MASAEGGSGSRRRSTVSSEVSARAAALAELKNLRQQGGRRVDGFRLKMEDKIYDTLPEAEYSKLVAERRQAAKDFVVEDNGLGYGDIGEEEDWEADVRPESSDEDEAADAKAKKTKTKPTESKKKEVTNRKTAALSAAASLMGKQRVSSMFAAASGTSLLRRPKDEKTIIGKSSVTADNILEDVLAEITADDVDRERERRRRKTGTGTNRVVMSSLSPVQTNPQIQQNFIPALEEAIKYSITSGGADQICVKKEVPCNGSLLEAQPHNIESVADCSEPVPEEDPHERTTVSLQKEQAVQGVHNAVDLVTAAPKDEGKSSMDCKVLPANKKESDTTHGLNAKINNFPGIKASAGWQAVCDAGTGMPVKSEEPVDDGIILNDGSSLPLDSEGKLLFFLLDAYEEAFGANPGTIFLFGKVRSGSKYVSCCVVVRNMQRCVYAVPNASVFPKMVIAELEQEASSGDPAKKVVLNRKLQEMAIGPKKELSQKLMDMDVVAFSMAPVKRSYAFERPDVPAGEQYVLKLSYAFKDAPLPADLKGVHFSALFGTHTSALELFLIKKKIKGPCWLLISNPICCQSSSQVSWCKMEVVVESPKDVVAAASSRAPQELPPVIVASINLKTVINHKSNVNEVASASIVYCRKVKIDIPMPQVEWNTHDMLSHFSIVRKLDGGIFPMGFTSEVAQINGKAGSNVLSCESSERALLNHLMIKLHQLDPDVLVGHNISGFDLDVLLHRLLACKVQSNIWSKIGRLRRSLMPKLSGGGATFGSGAGLGALACIAGRLLCDTYISSRDLLKEVSYTLTQLSKSQLGRERKEFTPLEIPGMYQSSASLVELVECGETDAWLALGLMFHLSVLPLTRQLTNISGNLWSKTLQGARAQRVEYLLLHEFHARKFIVPDKLSARDKEQMNQKRKMTQTKELADEAGMFENDIDGDEEAPSSTAGKRKKGPGYMGGLVLEPKKGLYDKYILLLDFNSLYPSIIQEFNICFTTVHRPSDGSIPPLPSADSPGVLPQVLKSLVERRRQVKQWLKRPSEPLKYQQLDIQQQALKLTANSMYGCLGFSNSRFYAKPIAELITAQGREILQDTVDLAQNNFNLEVIYGDTDSVMIHTGLDDLAGARSIAAKVIKEVNKKYKLLEIDLDGIFKRMLLLKKKKYAAVKVEANGDGTFREVIEQKGLDIVRRDWSMLSKEIGNFCLEQILSGGTCEDVVEAIHNQLGKLQEEMRNGQIDLEKYVITKTLTKSPEAYPDAKNQPHVQVALRLKQSGHRVGSSVGDTVPYVICIEQGDTATTSVGVAERARHPDELKQGNGNWMVDIDYYLSQQIHPVVSRLCAQIEGTDARHLADCLGLDSSKFQSKGAFQQVEKEDSLLSSSVVLDDDDRYGQCDCLQILCPGCTNRYLFPGLSSAIDLPQDSAQLNANEHAHGEPPKHALPSNSISFEDFCYCPKCRENGIYQRISPAMLANQVKQRAEEYIGRYYEGWMMCDDELCGHATRCMNLRVIGDTDRGTVCPKYPRCNGHLVRQYTEVDLYKQLTYFFRLLDADRALEKVTEVPARLAAKKRLEPLRPAVDLAAQTVKEIRDRCAYKWVQMLSLCVVI